ncbi:hypothetical protein QFC19_004770 [Naganishia cerealis]|uniref:Uncharacterized protein n=1 Tax=Naganishia cerealis TaxID=610337 RepID=A0ACC2VV43_9TREE|nr:hypothetical protein QFC19_004770 [Naganishia cerealis]
MAEAFYKTELRELAALPENKRCVDCAAPSPQWASVQLSAPLDLLTGPRFVRSITMDKWTPEQLLKLRQGGNAAFTAFVDSYGPAGGYPSNEDLRKIVNNAEGTQGGGAAGGMSAGGASAGQEKGRVMRHKYGCWAVAQYREKLAAESADPPTEWSPSSPPTTFTNLLSTPAPSLAPPGPANATRARGGRNSPMPSGTAGSRAASPFAAAAPGERGLTGSGGGGGGNEDFFAGLGEVNAQRKEGVPPSQGGKYTGFGSTPDPAPSSSHPAFALSSHAAPSLQEFQTAPLSALTKSWGLFSSAVTTAGKEIHTSVIQPGVARAGQTLEGETGYEARELAAKVAEQAKATTGWLSSIAGDSWSSLNTLARERAGASGGGGYGEVDLTERLGQMGLQPSSSAIARDHAQGGWDEGFTDDWDAPPAAQTKPAAARAETQKGKQAEPAWDDEWKEF